LTYVPTIEQHHGVDPFLGGYDNTDSMSVKLQASNSRSWASAIIRYLGDFGCRFRLHYGESVNMARNFKCNHFNTIYDLITA